MIFALIPETNKGGEIYVNVDHVLYIRPMDTNSCNIIMEKGAYDIVVYLPISRVVQLLENARMAT